MVALIMAVGRASVAVESGHVYDSGELQVI